MRWRGQQRQDAVRYGTASDEQHAGKKHAGHNQLRSPHPEGRQPACAQALRSAGGAPQQCGDAHQYDARKRRGAVVRLHMRMSLDLRWSGRIGLRHAHIMAQRTCRYYRETLEVVEAALPKSSPRPSRPSKQKGPCRGIQ
ncbi:hypothetical protein SDC9_131365 [bioreactor metagenome]|uniref:Uncharacterized protein n=1 Tax=bioreactor metagenome TaxID=1076179 RepID=A0A645D4P8_9ZZZZ